jgi:hypothetical protein
MRYMFSFRRSRGLRCHGLQAGSSSEMSRNRPTNSAGSLHLPLGTTDGQDIERSAEVRTSPVMENETVQPVRESEPLEVDVDTGPTWLLNARTELDLFPFTSSRELFRDLLTLLVCLKRPRAELGGGTTDEDARLVPAVTGMIASHRPVTQPQSTRYQQKFELRLSHN